MSLSTTTVHVKEVHEHTRKAITGDEDSLASDNAALAALGYKQEFGRAFHPVEVLGLSFSIIALFPSIVYASSPSMFMLLSQPTASFWSSPYHMVDPSRWFGV